MSIHIPVAEHILFEDEVALAIYKPGGLMVEPDRNGYPNLLNQVKKYLMIKSGLRGDEVYAQHIHRVDRPVSGIVLFAKQRTVLKNLSEQFAERRVKKYYEAMTATAPAQHEGTLDHWLRKEKKKAIIYETPVEWSEQVRLHYTLSPYTGDRYRWDIELHTGKYHQIRAQLAHIGCPVCGDEYYGATLPYKKDAIALNGYKLVFAHPLTGEEITVEKKITL